MAKLESLSAYNATVPLFHATRNEFLMLFSRDRVQVWGHRGWPARYPDNTMAGFGAALGVVPAIETDVRRTADGKLVLCHDPVFTGLRIAQTTWEVLATRDLSGHRPVLLDELLAAFPDRSFDLEVKIDPTEPDFDPSGALALEVAGRARPGDIVTSFYWPALERVRTECPDVTTGLLFDANIPWDAAVTHAVEWGHGALVPHRAHLAGHLDHLASVQGAGIRVATWTVNDPEDAIRLARAGVDAIISDHPHAIATAVAGIGRDEAPRRQP